MPKVIKFLLLLLLLFTVTGLRPAPVPAANTFMCSWSSGSCILSATGNTCLSGYTPSSAVCINLHDQPSCEQPHPCIPQGTPCTSSQQCKSNPASYIGCATAPNGEAYCAVDNCGYTNEFCCSGNTCDISTLNCIITATGPVCTVPPPAAGTFTGFCPGGTTGIQTALGCLDIRGKETISQILGWGVIVGGGIAFLLIVYAGFQMATAAGDPKRVKASQELLTAALGGLVLIVLSVVLLNFIGVRVLGLDLFGFKG